MEFLPSPVLKFFCFPVNLPVIPLSLQGFLPYICEGLFRSLQVGDLYSSFCVTLIHKFYIYSVLVILSPCIHGASLWGTLNIIRWIPSGVLVNTGNKTWNCIRGCNNLNVSNSSPFSSLRKPWLLFAYTVLHGHETHYSNSLMCISSFEIKSKKRFWVQLKFYTSIK